MSNGEYLKNCERYDKGNTAYQTLSHAKAFG